MTKQIIFLKYSCYINFLAVFVLSVTTSVLAESTRPTIRIGVISSEIAITAAWSDSAKAGLLQALTEINAETRPEQAKIELIFEDDQHDPKRAIAAFYKLIEQEKVDLLIGPQYDTTLGPVVSLANKYKVPLITTIGSTPINTNEHGYVFHSTPSDKAGGKCLADALKQAGITKTFAYVSEETYNQSFANFVLKELPQVKIEQFDYPIDNLDARDVLLKVRSEKPEALLLFATSPGHISDVIKKLHEQNLDLPIYTNEVAHASEFVKVALEKYKSTLSYCFVPSPTNNPAANNLITQLSPTPELPLYSLVAYDTLHWLAQLTFKTGANREKIKAAIYDLKYAGLLTSYSFDKYGDLQLSAWEICKLSAKSQNCYNRQE